MTSLIDLLALSRRIAADTAGEPEIGRAAVAWTYLNRASEALGHMRRHGVPHPAFGDGCLRTCLRPGMVAPGNIRQKLTDPALCRALATACLISCRDIADPTRGATHYHHHTDVPPSGSALRPVALIGSYFFYRPVCRTGR